MSINTDKVAIRKLAKICEQKGIRTVVFSPGSRCAPLVIAFNQQTGIECLSIVDERCAAFFALGIAQQTKTPVGLVCTSGTATLNYAPALAEAYYQRVPLLVLSSDRPEAWIDQADMQSIRQQGIFDNYIKQSFQLPKESNEPEVLWHSERIINEAINSCAEPDYGPVHLNIPLQEPLYGQGDFPTEKVKIIEVAKSEAKLSTEEAQQLKAEWKHYKRKLILVGMRDRHPALQTQLNRLVQDPSVVIMTETTSNLAHPQFINCIDRVIDTASAELLESFRPELLITCGGYIVSKKVKAFLRKHRAAAHWHLDKTGAHTDTYQSLNKILRLQPHYLLELLASDNPTTGSDYQSTFLDFDRQQQTKQNAFLKQAPFSDFKVFEILMDSLPTASYLQLGNSTPVRYSNLFDLASEQKITTHANRGVGGIDGTLSTAAGAAHATQQLTTLITGDLAFLYDSNGLWNRHLPSQLRIILINNDGGNIFRIIPGPDSTEELENFFEVKPGVDIAKLVAAYGIEYQYVDNENELKEKLGSFYELGNNGVKLLEIKTDGVLSAQTLRDYFEFLKN